MQTVSEAVIMNSSTPPPCPPPVSLGDNIAAFDGMRASLEAAQLGKWALVNERMLIGVFDTFEAAATTALEKYGDAPYLIRRIGAHSVTLPASVMFGPARAVSVLRV